ncbi:MULTISPECIES: type II toxin-antitoxin system RelE family toxin [Nocardiopsis]|uniref:Plasmid stabilization protein n=1 Tax=Nocardiopsis dassonvillei (strain ATCC 23218 / DSM 43111 / CIP 107115 / JCM 7437 / KCTC 9190 / NBRC 14626 / NCTC 10488 / NRRL B-5397 / IMRU 509) TaxID=446468 RepID=D7B4J2_NOCDD|nr:MULTISPECIES: hypothetical protein [Nocardiopsis]ADH68987.1 conserved hypothetical protein [Nocardiopsis dassonvillei subsp. dassonvillei DSM 43111]APC37031.1 hypothetical protein A9R04_21220 [Nocardiopsis dassonvillei]NKY82027.1 hypothetical protein [Nocardiopsis dassonvillei]VEI89496.1 Toxin RelG [Nocardiopsis dassonvillei]
MSDRYEIVLARTARRALSETLPDKVATAAWELIRGDLRENPRKVGKRLNPPYGQERVARRATYRIRFGIDDDKGVIVVCDIRGRADAYHYSVGR